MLIWTDASGAKITVFLLAMILFAAGVVHLHFSRLPTWSIIRHDVRIKFADDDGRKAVVKKTLKLRCNRSGIQHYTHRNISLDGDEPEFSVGPAGVTLRKIEKKAGDWAITVAFPTRGRLLSRRTTWLEIAGMDIFTEDTESFTLLVDKPIKEAEVEITAPANRSFMRARGIFYGADDPRDTEQQPYCDDSCISWSQRNRLMGLRWGEYAIEWDW